MNNENDDFMSIEQLPMTNNYESKFLITYITVLGGGIKIGSFRSMTQPKCATIP